MPVFTKSSCLSVGSKTKAFNSKLGVSVLTACIAVGNEAQSTKRYSAKLHNIAFFCHHHFTRGAGVCPSCLGVEGEVTHTLTVGEMSASFVRFHVQL